MTVKKTTIEGGKIICEIDSSNLKTTEYDTDTKTLVVEFKNGSKYEYEEFPHEVYARFRLSESQGKFFNAEISKKYKYKKLEL